MNNMNINDKIRGCLIGGAAGDALGYAVEFISIDEIENRYGREGIRDYALSSDTGLARISDDTQMTMFTAAGLMNCLTENVLYSTEVAPRIYVKEAYFDWLMTQNYSRLGVQAAHNSDHEHNSWLWNVDRLFAWRAPGNTCMSALKSRYGARARYDMGDYINRPINDSKGCGGVMRAAPVGLIAETDVEALDVESAEIAAITHGHSMGYLPAAVLTHIVNRLVYPEKEMTLGEIIAEAVDTVSRLYANEAHLPRFAALMNRAAELAGNDDSDIVNIRRLGAGWVGDEALAIAVYCCMRHEDSFSEAIIAAANHSGDSDSTAAIAGNIMGAMHGYEAIEDKWKQKLELSDVILALADDMTAGFRDDAQWKARYDSKDWRQ